MSDKEGYVQKKAKQLAAEKAKKMALKLIAKIFGWQIVVVLLVLILILCITIGITMSDQGSKEDGGISISAVGEKEIPKDFIPVYQEAAARYGIPWTLLAAVHKVETSFGSDPNMVSSAGAVGHFQFMPKTWVGWSFPGTPSKSDWENLTNIKKYGGYGIDADGDGKADPYNIKDAAYTAANYLKASGAPGDLHGAIFAYNHADWYVDRVMKYYNMYTSGDYTASGGTTIVGSNDTIEKAIQAGMSLVGKSPYSYGAGRNQSQIDQRLFDCSSFVHWAYNQAGVNLGPVSSVTVRTIIKLGKSVSVMDMQRGDLLFFDTEGPNTHIGIYLGDGVMLNDQNTYGVSVASVTKGYWKNTFNGSVRRVVITK
ncbi:C40 family peptidase [Listeria booriae]|nr:bifunctional lytic transglycosylase/C40 family peptidase [Listeria booriae]